MDSKAPILLCHAACSGGSLIYRILVSSFDFAGVSEVCHNYPFTGEAFIPSDPELAFLISQSKDHDQFERIFLQRVINTLAMSSEVGKQLLIREHTHSYFFNTDQPPQPWPHPSWIAYQLAREYGIQPKCIVSVRDPIDSWLSLRINFPRHTPEDFETYCRQYLLFVEAYELAKHDFEILLIKYENVIANAEQELKKISAFVDIPFSGASESSWSKVSSTGNSGRQSENLEIRKRRPFEYNLIRKATQSRSYQQLIDHLGYEHLSITTSGAQRARALVTPVVRIPLQFAHRLLKPIKTKLRNYI